jgi:ADP-heptose:LPS heptosyltransferase
MDKRQQAPERGKGSLRFLDRYLGVPLIYALGLIKRKRQLVPSFHSIGVLVTAAIGDTILLSGVISDLRRQFPDKEIVLFTTESNYEMGQLLSGTDRVVKLSATNPFRGLRKFRDNKVDVLCDFGPWQRLNALYSRLSGASFSVGFRTASQYRHYGYDRVVDHSPRVHEIENYRALVGALGIRSTAPPRVQVKDPLIEELKPKTYVVFHPWPGGYKARLKEWPGTYWLELGESVANLGFGIVLTGARFDAERTQELCSKLTSRCKRGAISLAGRISLSQTVRVLENASAVVSVNTGTMHLAAAAGAVVLGLHGPTSVQRWGPLGERAAAVKPEAEGCGYLNLGFEYKNQREDCMELITPQRVFELLQDRLRGLTPELGLERTLG